MSTPVFPAPTAQQFGIGWPIRKAPMYATTVQTPVSGRGEVRLSKMPYPRWLFSLDVTYLVGDCSLPSSAFATLVGFFMAAQGRAQEWLYQDPYDNAVAAMPFGTGDGETTAFQLTRQLATGGADIIQNLNGTPAIYVSGVLTSALTIGSTGIVTFNSAPGAGAPLTWTGQFYFRCRFDDDYLGDLSEDLYQLWSLGGLKFRSVIL